jgi:hypothetical protein
MNSQTDAYNAKISALLKSSEPNEATRLLRAGDRMQDRAGTAGFRSATANNRASTILAEKADDEDAIRRNECGTNTDTSRMRNGRWLQCARHEKRQTISLPDGNAR